MHIGFFVNLSTHGIFQAFAGFDKSGDRRVAAVWPILLSTQEATLAVRYQYDDRRVNPRKYLSSAIVVGTDPGITGGGRACRRAANAAKHLRRMPNDQCSRMSGQISFVWRQYGAEKAQVMKFAKLSEGRVGICADRKRERRTIVKKSKKYQLAGIVDEAIDLPLLEHDDVQRVAAHQRFIAPNRNEAALLAL